MKETSLVLDMIQKNMKKNIQRYMNQKDENATVEEEGTPRKDKVKMAHTNKRTFHTQDI